MKGITEKQSEILDFINAFVKQEGMAPTITEISEHFNVTPATAFAHIRALRQKGLLNRTSKARSISIPGGAHPSHFSMSLSIPLLGRISAGIPGEVEEHVERYITLDPSMLSKNTDGEPLFAVTVQGESMRDAGILEGDILIARREYSVKSGSIVVALVDDAVTVKYIYVAKGKWELRPANPDYHSIYVDFDRLQIQGTVIGLFRNF